MRAELYIAGRQLWHRKLLGAIAVLGVTLGVLSLIAITGIMRGFQTKFLSTILQISPHVVLFDTTLGQTEPIIDQLLGGDGPAVTAVARQASSDRQRRIVRPGEIVRTIRAMPGVDAVAPLVVGNAVASTGSKETPVEIRGVDPLVQDRVTPLRANIVAGRFDDLAGGSDGALVGSQLADLLGLGVGDNLTCASARGQRVVVRVVAIFDTGVAVLDKGRVYLTTRLAQTLLGRGDAIDRIELRLRDPDDAGAITARLEAQFGYDAESWQQTNASMLGVFGQQNLITGMMIGAVLLVGGFGILSIQIMVVLEKRRDIALLKAVGYSSRNVLTIFLAEGAVVAVIGASLGAGLGHLVLLGMRQIKSASGMGYARPSTFAIYERPSVYVLAFVFAVVVGLLASLVPAWRASRLEPVDVLRGS
ncbi:MAG: ABC transporter permease [Kofleriaceae bacterium]|jgi:lipoprotein-releasing system permease protein|nr:ABC transporter permease [Kofleriaceae bacterium]